ncbi:MAG: hypothetical protein GX817_03925 [Elusimicrobia bacterium]|nr:hypothetical protein [Elusimicrobiota bacterium]
MRELQELRDNTEELIKRYLDCKKQNEELLSKIQRLEMDLRFLEEKNQQLPEIVLKNRELLNEREKIAGKVEVILKRIERLTAA